MSEDYKKVLKMVKEGTISIEEAEELLDAVKMKEQEISENFRRAKKTVEKKYLHIKVNGVESDKQKVNVRIPLALIRGGVKLMSYLPQNAKEKVEAALKEKGLNFNIGQNPEEINKIIEALSQTSIDVDSEGNRVQVFCD